MSCLRTPPPPGRVIIDAPVSCARMLTDLEHRVVLSYTFPGIGGITLDTFGDVFVSYNSTVSTGQSQSVAEFNANGRLVGASVFSTTETTATPGVLTLAGSSASLPGITSSSDILELQPDGQLDFFDPGSESSTSPVYDESGQRRRRSRRMSMTFRPAPRST